MIHKSEKLIITFHTTTAAMSMEHLCKAHQTAGRLIPVPTSISADCGLAWCAPLDVEDEVLTLIHANHICYQGIYHCMV